jgi:DNA-3-methyladenine glycosylase
LQPREEAAARAPWRLALPPLEGFPGELLELPVREAARALLGSRLVSTVGDDLTIAVIVETEAYAGPDDPASHASTVRGVTERNRAMFGPPGRAYVYRSYGVHWCMNVVTGGEGAAEAVLIRGVEPVEGAEVMARRRAGRRPLGAGPGRLCAALGITDALYGHDLRQPPLLLAAGWRVPDDAVGVSRRVGVSAATEWPCRFYVKGSPGVSRPDGWGSLDHSASWRIPSRGRGYAGPDRPRGAADASQEDDG